MDKYTGQNLELQLDPQINDTQEESGQERMEIEQVGTEKEEIPVNILNNAKKK